MLDTIFPGHDEHGHSRVEAFRRRLWLLLGSDAVHLAERGDLARIEADRKWRDVSVSTDFETGGGARVYPWERR